MPLRNISLNIDCRIQKLLMADRNYHGMSRRENVEGKGYLSNDVHSSRNTPDKMRCE